LVDTLLSKRGRDYFYRAARGTSGSMVKIDRALLEGFPLLVPPLPEQRKIAAILSSVDEAIEGTQAVIDQLQVVKKAMMADLLTRGIPGRHKKFKQTEIGEVPADWDVVPVDHWLSRLIDYRGKSPPKASSGIPLVTAKNVRDGFINAEPREFISDDSYDTWMTRGIPDAGDILFTTEAPLGKAASVPTTKIALGQRLITLCPQRDRLDPTYLLWVLLSPAFQELLRSKATGSTVQGIKQSVFRTLPISIPPFDEQVVIAQAIQSVANQGSVEGAYLVSLRAVKSALMSVLLTGEVRVRVDEEEAA
jgi:type I restriction enzyme S subunit